MCGRKLTVKRPCVHSTSSSSNTCRFHIAWSKRAEFAFLPDENCKEDRANIPQQESDGSSQRMDVQKSRPVAGYFSTADPFLGFRTRDFGANVALFPVTPGLDMGGVFMRDNR
jgi:hypothetical protein